MTFCLFFYSEHNAEMSFKNHSRLELKNDSNNLLKGDNEAPGMNEDVSANELIAR